MNWLWYSLLLSPIAVTVWCASDRQSPIPYPLWFALTSLGIAYGILLAIWHILWLPINLFWVLNWPCCLDKLQGFDALWTSIAAWVVRSELMLMACICTPMSIWIKFRLAAEWRKY